MASPQGALTSQFSSAKNREDGEFMPVDIIPCAEMKITRENPTSAFIRMKAGMVEPLHHHTYAYDFVVIKGKKTVWNLTSGTKYEMEAGDHLFTPAGDRHRVLYHEDMEFFMKWNGHWDFIMDDEEENQSTGFGSKSWPI